MSPDTSSPPLAPRLLPIRSGSATRLTRQIKADRALGVARYSAGSYEAAIEALKRVPPGGEPLFFLVLAEAMAGQAEAAREHAAQLMSQSPSLTVEGYIRDGVTDLAMATAIRDGATKAGLLPTPTQ
jgi:hypothetical protein